MGEVNEYMHLRITESCLRILQSDSSKAVKLFIDAENDNLTFTAETSDGTKTFTIEPDNSANNFYSIASSNESNNWDHLGPIIQKFRMVATSESFDQLRQNIVKAENISRKTTFPGWTDSVSVQTSKSLKRNRRLPQKRQAASAVRGSLVINCSGSLSQVESMVVNTRKSARQQPLAAASLGAKRQLISSPSVEEVPSKRTPLTSKTKPISKSVCNSSQAAEQYARIACLARMAKEKRDSLEQQLTAIGLNESMLQSEKHAKIEAVKVELFDLLEKLMSDPDLVETLDPDNSVSLLTARLSCLRGDGAQPPPAPSTRRPRILPSRYA